MSRTYNWCSSSSGTLNLWLTLEDAESASHQGECENDVVALARKPCVKAQLQDWEPADLAAELKEYGAWDTRELADHERNLIRMLWLAAGEICDRVMTDDYQE